jgi:ligand-binding sensor domain-containing protein
MKNQLTLIIIVLSSLITNAQQTWKNISDTQFVSVIVPDGTKIWMASKGGLMCIDKINGDTTFYNNANSDMPFTEVSGMCLDINGRLWLSSAGGGIACKDGDEWTPFNTTNTPLPNNRAFSITSDSQGIIWAGLSNYLVRFDGVNWTTFGLDTLGGSTLFPMVLGVDKDDRVLLGSGGLRAFDGHNYVIYDTANSPLQDNRISFIKTFPDGKTWIGHPFNGLTVTDFTNWEVYDTLVPGVELLKVYAFDRTSDGNYWLGTYNGELYHFDGSNWSLRFAESPVDSLQYIYALAVDESDNLYISALQSSMFDGDSWEVINTAESNFRGNVVQGIFHASDNSAWIANYEGMTRIQGNQISNYKDDDLSTYLSTTCYAEDNDGKIYTAHYNGVSLFINNSWVRLNIPPHNLFGSFHINDMCFDEGNNLWIASYPGLIKFDGTDATYFSPYLNNFPEYEVRCLDIDMNGNIIAGVNDGIVIQNGNGWITRIIPDPPYSDLKVWDIAVKNNDLWLGTSSGLVKYDGSEWVIFHPENSPMPDYSVRALDFDSNDNLWFTNGFNNLAKYDGQNFEIITYFESGMLGGPHNRLRIDNHNNIWFGGYNCAITVYNENGIYLNAEEIDAKQPAQDIISLVYPNPTSGEINISYKIPDNQSEWTLLITNLQGKRIDCLKLYKNETMLTYDASKLSSGMYLISISDGTKTISTKIQIVR